MAPVNTQAWAKWFGLETFDDPEVIKAIEAGARFVLDIKAGKMPWLILLGTSGVAKTHIARKIWKWWLRSGAWVQKQGRAGMMDVQRSGQFCLWADFIQECRDKDSSRLDDLVADDFVILDDIGAGTDARKWMADKLYMICEKRLHPTKAFIATANMTLEQLADAYDQRIASRLLRRGTECVVTVETIDFNLR